MTELPSKGYLDEISVVAIVQRADCIELLLSRLPFPVAMGYDELFDSLHGFPRDRCSL